MSFASLDGSASASVVRRRCMPDRFSQTATAWNRVLVHQGPAMNSVCVSSGDSYVRSDGDIDLVPMGEEIGFRPATAVDLLEIALAPGLLNRTAAELGWRGERRTFAARHMLRNDVIVHLAQAFHRSEPGRGTLYADSLGVALSVQLLGAPTTVGAAEQLSAIKLRRVFDYVNANLDQPLTVALLSAVAGASVTALQELFKAATGTTIHRYVLQRRVERARVLILAGELSVSEVALAVGFAHQSHLARWMRHETGLTPAHLRHLQRESGSRK